jgi:hypothetical protein
MPGAPLKRLSVKKQAALFGAADRQGYRNCKPKPAPERPREIPGFDSSDQGFDAVTTPGGRQRASSKALISTLTDDIAIASPATTGDK